MAISEARAAAERECAELRARLAEVMRLHGDGGYCLICDHGWSCPTWRAASGLEEKDEPDEGGE